MIAAKDKWSNEYNLVLDKELKVGRNVILVILVILGKGKNIAKIKQ